MNRRLMLSTILAGGATALMAPAVGAADWCDDDPLVKITLPDGKTVDVHVTNYALGNHMGALLVVHNNPNPPYINYVVEGPRNSGNGDDKDKKDGTDPKGQQKKKEWQVTMWVTIPGRPIPGDAVEGRFKVKTVVSTQPYAKGTILDRDEGWSDVPMRLRFSLTA